MKACFPKSLKTGEAICFKTVDQAVYDNNGVPLSDRLSDIKKKISDNTVADKVLEERVNTLTTEGTNDGAEVADIRVTYDGITFTTDNGGAGEAVRYQFRNAFNAITELTKHTRNAPTGDIDIYSNITKLNNGIIATDYVTFPYICSVSVPTTYQVMITRYSYDETTQTYTQIASSSWVNKYPIPKDTICKIGLRHVGDNNITTTEIAVLSFVNEYPEFYKNATLNKAGFYDTLQYQENSNGKMIFSLNQIMSSRINSLDKVVFVKAKEGYQCKIIRYTQHIQEGSGDLLEQEHDYGWSTEHFIPAQSPFSFCFSKTNGSTLYFDEFINNFEVEYVQLDNVYLNNLISSMTGIGIIGYTPDVANSYVYGQIVTRLTSPELFYDYPITMYIDDINSSSRLAYHILDETDKTKIVYDSQWTTSITIPAKLPVRIYFKDDQNEVDIKNMYDIKVKDNIDMLPNEFIKDIAHRGLSKYAPENTMQAFKYAKLQGFKYVECDVKFTSDNVAVLLHDDSIDRTARDNSGNPVTGYIKDLTYEDVKEYDFGHWFVKRSTNIKIPKFDDFIVFCKINGLHPYIHVESDTNNPQNIENIQGLCDTVHFFGMSNNVTWISYNKEVLITIKNYSSYSNARLGFISGPGGITDDTIDVINEQLKQDHHGEVFIDSSSFTDDDIYKCRGALIPLEVWTINDIETVKSLNIAISGVTSDYLQASKMIMQAKYDEYLNLS